MPDENDEQQTCAVLELLGHKTIAGEIQKIENFGAPMIRVTVPETDQDHPAFTRDYSPAAIYSITYVDPRVMLWTARQIAEKPIGIYVPEIDDLNRLHQENARLKKVVGELTADTSAHPSLNTGY